MTTRRTPSDTDAKTHRCKATQGDEQCQRARHSEMTSHTWGAQGETRQWRADGAPKTDSDRRVDRLDDDAPTEEIRAVGHDDPSVEPTVTSTALAAIGPRHNGDAFDKLSAKALHALTQLTEAKRFADAHHFEADTAIELLTVAVESAAHVYERRLVDPGLIDKGRLLTEAWAIQRGLRKINGAGS